MSDINKPTINIGSHSEGHIIAGRDMNVNQDSKPGKDHTGMGIKKDSIRKILILATNPLGTNRLRLDKEVSKIGESLQSSKHQERFEIRAQLAVRIDDIQKTLLDYDPHIVHFTGHGEEEGLMVEDELGFPVQIDPQALTDLFRQFSHQINCVVLSACYSGPQAAAIAKHIDYVVGMKRAIKDKAAIAFAVGFYGALFAGRTVSDAFELGSNAIRLKFPKQSEYLIPLLYKGGNT